MTSARRGCALKLARAERSVLLCGDATIHALDRDHRKEVKATDARAFAMREGDDGHLAGDLLGDVIISLETAARQARERGVTSRDEMRMLLAHGLLQRFGQEHRTDAADRQMHADTDRMVAVVDRAANATARRAEE